MKRTKLIKTTALAVILSLAFEISAQAGILGKVKKWGEDAVGGIKDTYDSVVKAAQEPLAAVRKTVEDKKKSVQSLEQSVSSLQSDVARLPPVFKPEVIARNVTAIKINRQQLSLPSIPDLQDQIDVIAELPVKITSAPAVDKLLGSAVKGAKIAGRDISREWKRFGDDIAREGKKFWGDVSREVNKCFEGGGIAILHLCDIPPDPTCEETLADDDSEHEEKMDCYSEKTERLRQMKCTLIAMRSQRVRSLEASVQAKIRATNNTLKELGEVSDD